VGSDASIVEVVTGASVELSIVVPVGNAVTVGKPAISVVV
jgi:hypothetical protein